MKSIILAPRPRLVNEALTLLNSLMGSSMLRASLVSQSATAVSAKSLGTVLYGRDRRLYRRMGGRTADVRVNIITRQITVSCIHGDG